jgi:hypothetical protein
MQEIRKSNGKGLLDLTYTGMRLDGSSDELNMPKFKGNLSGGPRQQSIFFSDL